MELGMVGLGRMGYGMTARLLRAGHRVVGYDRRPEAVKRAAEEGADAAYSIGELAEKLPRPRTVWMMLPAGEAVEETVQGLSRLLEAGDIIVDGGNSNYRDTKRRAAALRERGIGFVDVGISGGVWGRREGYCMMVGGEEDIVQRLTPIFEALAPAPGKGWSHLGPNGAGHYVKMVHNAIEYGVMESYAEGFSLLRRKAEFGLDLHRVAETWRHGSIIRSFLLDLTAQALAEDQELRDVEPYVPDTGAGRWAVFEAIEADLPAPALTMSLLARLRSRDRESFSDRLLAVMRQRFGGHAVEKVGHKEHLSCKKASV